MEDLWRLSAAEIATLIGSKKVSAKEAATAALARLEAVNPAINAVVDHRPEDVLAQAEAIDAAIARNEEPGPLAGVPVTVKVNIDQQGFATTNGLKLQRDVIARSNSPVIDNLRKAGAVILGRTNCPAFSYRWFTTNLIHGDTKNPRDPSITPGGSSGGAGAAVAAGIGHIAHGTDIAGSIRYPAYACGVHGLRPTVGRIAAFNAALPERTIGAADHRGVRSRSRAPSAISGSRLRRCRPEMRAIPGGCRRRWKGPRCRSAPRCASAGRSRARAEVKAAVADAGKRLERAGWTVEEIENTPPLREAADLQTKLWLGDGYEAQLAAAEREGDPGALACLRGNKAKVFPFDAAAFSKALTRRATLTREWLLFLETYSVLLMPVSGELPFPDRLDRGRGFLCAGMAGATAANRHSLYGAACANGLHRLGGPNSGRRSGGLRPLPRGSLPARGRGDRSRRNAVGADRSRELDLNDAQ